MIQYNTPHILERRFIPQGRIIMRQGELADYAYIIQSGMIEIFTERNGAEVVLARLKPGEIFGELALLFDEPRTASARAVQESILVVITRSVLDQKLQDTDPTISAIVRMMKERLKQGNLIRTERETLGIEHIHERFAEAMAVIMAHIKPENREEYRAKASPALKEFLDLTQNYLDMAAGTDGNNDN